MADLHGDADVVSLENDMKKIQASTNMMLRSAARNNSVLSPAAITDSVKNEGHERSPTHLQQKSRLLPAKTAFYTSELCEAHRILGHPESYERVRSIRERILKDFPEIHHISAVEPVSKEQLLLFHTPKHVEAMYKIFQDVRERIEKQQDHLDSDNQVIHSIDEDTAVTEGTELAAFAAAGAVCDAVDMVMKHTQDMETKQDIDSKSPQANEPRIQNAFCGVRPPGHHAEPNRAMGFCLFNNVGIGALHLLKTYPQAIKKVLIFDFDVHHGNGTQAKFTVDHPQVLYISTHQSPFYPNTGKANERGSDGNIVNVPMIARTGSKAYRKMFEMRVLPAMHTFKPDFIFISAGFDAHEHDPLADIALVTEDYYWITKQVVAVAWKYAHGRIVSVLEGGYNLDALADSAAAHVAALVEGVVPSQDNDIDLLTAAFKSSVAINSGETQDLRVMMHYDKKEKLIVLKDRTLEALEQQCKNKFNLKGKKKKKTKPKIHDCHGTLITADLLLALPNDQHLYLC